MSAAAEMQNDPAGMWLAGKARGRAEAAEEIAELRAANTKLRREIEAALYNDGHLPGCLAARLADERLCHAACRRLRAAKHSSSGIGA